MRLRKRRNTTGLRDDPVESADPQRSSTDTSDSEKPVLALLEVDEDGNVSEEEIGRFMRELGLPENND